MLYRRYEPASGHCSGAATPGARALMSWFLGAYGARGATNLGIYVCRDIPGSSEPSLHSDGRADDLGVPVGAPWAQGLADALVAHSGELGIQCVIYNRHIWSGSYWDQGWRPYNGTSAHTEHLHVELSINASRVLTVPFINLVMNPAPPPPPPPKGPLDMPDLLIADTHGTPGKIYARYADGRTAHLGPSEAVYWQGRNVPQISLTLGERDEAARIEAARIDV